MAPRPPLPIRRIAFLRPFRPPNSSNALKSRQILRLFTQNTLAPQWRPQSSFLSMPNRHTARYISTETRRWFTSEMKKTVKYLIIIQVFLTLGWVVFLGICQERFERMYPSPSEWKFLTRLVYRTSRFMEKEPDPIGFFDYVKSAVMYQYVREQLENLEGEGKGLQEQVEGGLLVEGVGKTGFDVSAKSEEWRNAYYETLIGSARCAEFVDGWMKDVSRKEVQPGNMVIGHSNPNPKPVPPGKTALREENCEPFYPPPETFYMKILTTKGFTNKQKLDAALGYGNWLDFKKAPEAAGEMYKWALELAVADATTGLVDRETGILNVGAGNPNENVLAAVTGLAIHHAANGNVNAALPIFLSILRARRSLPAATTPEVPREQPKEGVMKLVGLVQSTIAWPSPAQPPSDGLSTPVRNAKARCEEAGIMTYIGEILYASKSSKTSREDGLAWTREAVDLAEIELHKKSISKEGEEKCKECMKVGLGNWAKMVRILVKEEKEKKANGSKAASWWGTSGADKKQEAAMGRWETEEKVVLEKVRRASELLGAKEYEILGI
ncbi:hypothetical protein B0O99DRAFT_606820 [Bisporella sp. PMI_857]|nr:hypothetical protein B0O99DRAFT_606820 [Bisporella sp. PMI_857]